jgi:hypothetical protein
MHEDAMKRLFGSTLALAALLSLLPACEQPKAGCTAGVGAFAAKYTLKPGSKVGQGSCDALKGEILGLLKYNPLKKGETKVQDLTTVRLVIRSTTLGELSVAAGSAMVKDAAHDPNSDGEFVSTVPDENDVCSVPKFSTAEQDLPAFQTPPPDMTMVPATHIKYDWSKVRLYVTAAYPGTQMVGDLTYTEDGCSATYSVIGLWPAVSCEGKDDQGMPNGTADPTLCDPVANLDAGHATGSGINPDLKARVACDPDILLCILTAPPDALR